MEETKIMAQVFDEEGNIIDETELSQTEVDFINQYRTAGADTKAAIQKLLS